MSLCLNHDNMLERERLIDGNAMEQEPHGLGRRQAQTGLGPRGTVKPTPCRFVTRCPVSLG